MHRGPTPYASDLANGEGMLLLLQLVHHRKLMAEVILVIGHSVHTVHSL